MAELIIRDSERSEWDALDQNVKDWYLKNVDDVSTDHFDGRDINYLELSGILAFGF